MTETEWLSCQDPQPMLEYLRQSRRMSDRKARLFSCACCRRILHHLTDDRFRKALKVAERYADGLLAKEVFAEAAANAREANKELPLSQRLDPLRSTAVLASQLYLAYQDAPVAERLASTAASAILCLMDWRKVRGRWSRPESTAWHVWRVRDLEGPDARNEENRAQSILLRCIVGNPFEPAPAIGPAMLTWQSGLVVKLAEAAYEERVLPARTLKPDRMAVLADALQEAGCENEEVLAHLRSPGPYVRGCFAVDLLLRRE
jgi:histone H3/H4